MTAVLEKQQSFTPEQKADRRERILEIEKTIAAQEGAFFGDTENCPLEHFFGHGTYVRKMSVPAGTLFSGKRHRFDHVIVVVSGVIDVISEDKEERIEGPCIYVAEAGTKKLCLARSEVVWLNVHDNPDNKRDIENIEERVIAPDFDNFLKGKQTFIQKMKTLWHSF